MLFPEMPDQGDKRRTIGAQGPRQATGPVAVAMLGGRRHYAVARALHAAGLLDCLFTDLWAHCWVCRALALAPGVCSLPGMRHLLNRRHEDIPAEKIVQFPLWGLWRLAARAGRVSTASIYRFYAAQNSRFCSRVAAAARSRTPAAFYAFNAAALEIFEACCQRGVRCILDQAAAPWEYDEQLLAEERDHWPGWEAGQVREDDWRPLAKRERQEWELADRIVCGSAHVVEAVKASGGPFEKCEVVPYFAFGGGDNLVASRGPDATRIYRTRPDGRCRVLFVGTLCLRKGIQYLWEAARLLSSERACGRVMLRAIGTPALSQSGIRALREVMEVLPPVARPDLAGHYRWADVLALPSLSEGSANVGYEALAAGLPLIVTAQSGLPVQDRREAVLIPARSGRAIAEAIRHFLDRPQELAEMSAAALRTAATLSESSYAERLVKAIAHGSEFRVREMAGSRDPSEKPDGTRSV